MRLIALLLLAFSLAASADEPAPAFAGPTLAGGKFDLAGLKGHPVIVNFWATWCVPCRAEMPMLSDYYKAHHGDGVEMVGISVDSPSAMANVKKIAETVSYPIVVARDAAQNAFPAANALPVTYLIDAKGVVRARLTPEEGDLTADKLSALVAKLRS